MPLLMGDKEKIYGIVKFLCFNIDYHNGLQAGWKKVWLAQKRVHYWCKTGENKFFESENKIRKNLWLPTLESM